MSHISKISLSRGTITKIAALALGTTAAVACSDSNSPATPSGVVRVVNAAPLQAQAIVKVGTTTVSSVAFASGTSFLASALTTARTFNAYASNGTTLLASQDLVIEDGKAYNLVLAQTASGVATTTFLSFPDTVSAPATGKVKVRVLNVSPAVVAAYDVYVVDVGTNLATATPQASGVTAVAYLASSLYFEVPAGNKRIVVTAPGTTTVLAEIATLNLSAGAAITALTLDKANGGAPIQMLYWQDR